MCSVPELLPVLKRCWRFRKWPVILAVACTLMVSIPGAVKHQNRLAELYEDGKIRRHFTLGRRQPFYPFYDSWLVITAITVATVSNGMLASLGTRRNAWPRILLGLTVAAAALLIVNRFWPVWRCESNHVPWSHHNSHSQLILRLWGPLFAGATSGVALATRMQSSQWIASRRGEQRVRVLTAGAIAAIVAAIILCCIDTLRTGQNAPGIRIPGTYRYVPVRLPLE